MSTTTVNQATIEKVKKLAKTLKEISQNGEGGEKENAADQLTRLMKKYKISESDLVQEKKRKRIFPTKNKLHRQFIHQMVINTVGKIDSYRILTKSGRQTDQLMYELTDIEYIEVQEKVHFFWRLFNEELDIFYSAFIQKNKLYIKNPKVVSGSELTEKDKRIMDMAESVKSDTIKKKIGTGNTKQLQA